MDENTDTRAADDAAGSRIEACWRRVDPDLAGEIATLWREASAVPDPQQAQDRTAEAVCVARDGDGRLVGVATAQPRRIPFLGQVMYYFRAFVAPGQRGGALAMRLLRESQRILATDAASAAPASPAIGLFLELENPVFRREGDRAVWQRTELVYAGLTPRGLQRRIWYFPGARLASG